MSDYTLPPCSTLVVGKTGSGKTTFALEYLRAVNCSCRFVFDDLGQAAARLKRPHSSTAAELEAALSSKWVIFNPHRMFPGQVESAFKYFCHWTLTVSGRAEGKKVLLTDEVWRFCSPHAIPQELAAVAQMGRAENLELLTCTQMPHKLHSSLTGSSTELVCFRLDEPLALGRVGELGASPDAISTLPMGSYVAHNRISGSKLSGKMF